MAEADAHVDQTTLYSHLKNALASAGVDDAQLAADLAEIAKHRADKKPLTGELLETLSAAATGCGIVHEHDNTGQVVLYTGVIEE